MRATWKVLAVLVLGIAILVLKSNAASGGGAEAFDKLKSLAGHWETDKTNKQKATLDLELTAGGTAVREKFRLLENGHQWK